MRRMSFSPGKNNLKLLVLLEAGVQIWDVRELELINELRTPLDTARVEDGDWASSDRVVLAGQDGCIRLAGLALAGTSSHCLAYGRHQVSGGFLNEHCNEIITINYVYCLLLTVVRVWCVPACCQDRSTAGWPPCSASRPRPR